MNRKIAAILALGLGVIFGIVSCSNSGRQTIEEEEVIAQLEQHRYRPQIIVVDEIKITEVLDYPPFEDVSLKLITENVRFRPGKNRMEFIVGKFFLGEQTAEESEMNTSINEGGQYLLLVDPITGNRSKYYAPNLEMELMLGPNYLASILVRSNNISLKGDSALQLYQIATESATAQKTAVEECKALYIDLVSPEPNQVFMGEQKILLDVVSNNMDWTKYNVKLKLDGKEVVLSNNNPYLIEGLTYGKHNVSIQLIDEGGKPVKSLLPTSKKYSFEISEDSGF